MSPLVGAALVVLFEGLSVAFLFPVLHAYCGQLGGGPLWTGILFALVAGPKVITNPLWGALADRIGRRPVLVIITLGTLSGSVAWALAPSLPWLAASRLVAGLFGAQAALANTIAADVTPPQRRAGAMAMLGAAFGVAITVGPVVGGLLGESTSYATVGWLGAALQTCSLLVILLLLQETRGLSPAGEEPAQQEATVQNPNAGRALLRRGDVLQFLAVSLVMTVGVSSLTSMYGLFTQQIYGFDAARTGLAFGIIGLVGVIVQGGLIRPLSARFGDARIAIAGLAVLAAGFAGLALRLPLITFLFASALTSVGVGLAMPCVTAMLSRQADEASQGQIQGFSQAAIGLGRAAGFAVGGAVFRSFGAPVPFAASAALSLIALALLWPLRDAARVPREATAA